jgi:hypothetical protein
MIGGAASVTSQDWIEAIDEGLDDTSRHVTDVDAGRSEAQVTGECHVRRERPGRPQKPP